MKEYTVAKPFPALSPRQATLLSRSTDDNGFLYIFPRIRYVDKKEEYIPIFFYLFSYK